MVSTRILTFNSSSPCTNPLVTVPRTPITIGITVNFTYHSFFSSLARSKYLSFFSFSFNYTQMSARTAKSTIRYILFFFFFFFFLWLSLALVVWLRLNDSFVYQNPRGVCASHSPGQILSCAYTMCSNLNYLHSSKWITLTYTLSVLACCNRLFCNWSLRRYHHIIFIGYFVVSYLFLFWYNLSLCWCFVLLLE